MKKSFYFIAAAFLALAACNTYKPELSFEQAVNHSNRQAVAYYIANGKDVNMLTVSGAPLILTAAYQADAEILRQLIQAGADVNAKASETTLANLYFDNAADTPSMPVPLAGFTALTVASAQGNIDNIKLLLEAKADVNAANSKGVTPLMAASGQGHLEAVKALLAAGADVNKQTSFNYNALSAAKAGKYQDVADLLIQAGAK